MSEPVVGRRATATRITEDLTPEEYRRLAAEYQRRWEAIIASSLDTQVTDIARIHELFQGFVTSALQEIPFRTNLTRDNIFLIIQSVATKLDILTGNLQGVYINGITNKQYVVNQINELYGDMFLTYGMTTPMIQLSPEDLALISNYTADLINVRTGGLASDILQEVSRTIRLAALGVGGDMYATATAIERAISGVEKWSVRAETIYRTEINRIYSILTQRSALQLDRIVPTSKRWRWSHISREEHHAIDMQTVHAHDKFKVPLREGGFWMMMYPRDASAPPSATINCGCFVQLIPTRLASAFR